MDKDRSNLELTLKTVENVRLANGHNSCQTLLRLNAFLDHLLIAIADKNNHLMDTHANHAELDLFKAQLTKSNVLDQIAVDNMISNSQLIPTTVEDVRHANGHNSLQTHQELNVFQEN
jgi:hypothetical protein